MTLVKPGYPRRSSLNPEAVCYAETIRQQHDIKADARAEVAPTFLLRRNPPSDDKKGETASVSLSVFMVFLFCDKIYLE